MKIQVAGPGCPRCHATEENVRDACAQLNLVADISHVFDVRE
ncbi:MAG: thioredoxin family protein, partial [Nitrospirota bacterium]|nr:thioredoxin family protein [Nitrospirota bacterium]